MEIFFLTIRKQLLIVERVRMYHLKSFFFFLSGYCIKEYILLHDRLFNNFRHCEHYFKNANGELLMNS